MAQTAIAEALQKARLVTQDRISQTEAIPYRSLRCSILPNLDCFLRQEDLSSTVRCIS